MTRMNSLRLAQECQIPDELLALPLCYLRNQQIGTYFKLPAAIRKKSKASGLLEKIRPRKSFNSTTIGWNMPAADQICEVCGWITKHQDISSDQIWRLWRFFRHYKSMSWSKKSSTIVGPMTPWHSSWTICPKSSKLVDSGSGSKNDAFTSDQVE